MSTPGRISTRSRAALRWSSARTPERCELLAVVAARGAARRHTTASGCAASGVQVSPADDRIHAAEIAVVSGATPQIEIELRAMARVGLRARRRPRGAAARPRRARARPSGSSSASCSGVRALAIGAATVGCAASQASATAATVVRGSRRDRRAPPARRARARRGSRARLPARGEPVSAPPMRYLPVRKPLASAKYGMQAEPFARAHGGQRALVLLAVHEVVVRLDRDVRGQVAAARQLERLGEARRGVVGRGDVAHLALADQLAEGARASRRAASASSSRCA